MTHHPSRIIQVAAAIVQRDGRYLIAKRKPGAHLGGFWEFPGGKRETGESLETCLKRELQEELGIEITTPEPFKVIRHEYPDRMVELHFFRCAVADGDLRPLGCEEIRWVTPSKMAALPFPEADQTIIQALSVCLAPARGEGRVRGPIAKARRLRREETDAERKLWSLLRSRQVGKYKFRRQHPIGNFVVDFCCPGRMVIVELEGSQHMTQDDKDQRRTAWLSSKGYRVLRFWNHDVFTSSDAVLGEILEALEVPSP